FQYAGLGELAKRLQPDGTTIEYVYDTEEQLIGVRNQRGELYQIRRDPRCQAIAETDFWGQSRRYAYSLGGQLRESIDPLARRIAYQTDALGQIVKKIAPHALDETKLYEETFAYDPTGNLVETKNAEVRVEREFDAEGRLLTERLGDYFVV